MSEVSPDQMHRWMHPSLYNQLNRIEKLIQQQQQQPVDWRNKLSNEQCALLSRAESTVTDWHEGSVDCWQWQTLVARLASILDEREVI